MDIATPSLCHLRTRFYHSSGSQLQARLGQKHQVSGACFLTSYFASEASDCTNVKNGLLIVKEYKHMCDHSAKHKSFSLWRIHAMSESNNNTFGLWLMQRGRKWDKWGNLFGLCSDTKNETIETLLKQYELVKLRTSNNNTYQQGSHVLQFGDLDIDEEPVADYFSNVAKTQQGPFPENPLSVCQFLPALAWTSARSNSIL